MDNLLLFALCISVTFSILSTDDGSSIQTNQTNRATIFYFDKSHYERLGTPSKQFRCAIKLGDFRMFRSIGERYGYDVAINKSFKSGDYPIHFFLEQMRQSKYSAGRESLIGIMSMGYALVKYTDPKVLKKEDQHGITPCEALSRVIPTKAGRTIPYAFFHVSKELNDRLHARFALIQP